MGLCGVSGVSCFALSFGWVLGAGCWWWVVLGGFIAGDCNKDERNHVFFLMAWVC